MKRILNVVMSMVLVASGLSLCTAHCGAAEVDGGQLLRKAVREDERQKVQTEQQQIQKIKNCNKIKTYFDNRDSDTFAGVYIGEDNEVVVKMTKKTKTDTTKIAEIDKTVVVEKSQYSYDELQETYGHLNNILDKLSEKNDSDTITKMEKTVFDNLSQFYVSIEDNCVYVYLNNLDRQKIQQFEEVFFTNAIIKYRKAIKAESAEDATTLKLGRTIYVYDAKKGWSIGSIGIKAYYINSSGKKVHGFITAGHVALAKGNKVYASNNRSNKEIGTVVKHRFKSGKVDAAFVKVTNSNYKISNQVYYSNAKGNTKGGAKIKTNIYAVLADGAIGMTIYKAGQTSHLTKGKLISDSATKKTPEGYVLKDTYECSYKAERGDSGGVVFFHDEDGYQYLGIHQGRVNKNAFVVKWENIADLWDIYFE